MSIKKTSAEYQAKLLNGPNFGELPTPENWDELPEKAYKYYEVVIKSRPLHEWTHYDLISAVTLAHTIYKHSQCMEALGDKLVYKAKNGEIKAHPLFKTVQELALLKNSLGVKLGLANSSQRATVMAATHPNAAPEPVVKTKPSTAKPTEAISFAERLAAKKAKSQ